MVSDYLDLRESPSQSPADFFYKSNYTSSLFHACSVGMEGRLQPGKVRMTEKLRKYCNLNQQYLNPIDVVSRMLNAACQRSRDRCNELYRLTRAYSFECPVCRYYHSNVRVSDFHKRRLGNNLIREFREDVKVNADSGVDEAGPSKKVAEVQPV